MGVSAPVRLSLPDDGCWGWGARVQGGSRSPAPRRGHSRERRVRWRPLARGLGSGLVAPPGYSRSADSAGVGPVTWGRLMPAGALGGPPGPSAGPLDLLEAGRVRGGSGVATLARAFGGLPDPPRGSRRLVPAGASREVAGSADAARVQGATRVAIPAGVFEGRRCRAAAHACQHTRWAVRVRIRRAEPTTPVHHGRTARTRSAERPSRRVVPARSSRLVIHFTGRGG